MAHTVCNAEKKGRPDTRRDEVELFLSDALAWAAPIVGDRLDQSLRGAVDQRGLGTERLQENTSNFATGILANSNPSSNTD